MATFLLVHGAWHDGSCWERVVDALVARGHEAVAPDLPCDDVEATFADYAEVASAAVPDDVVPVVVGHSYAGGTIPLVAALRPCARLVFVAAVLPGLGRADAPTAIDPAFTASFSVDALGRAVWDTGRAVDVMYAGLPEAQSVASARRLRPQSWTPSAAAYPLTAMPEVPCTYVRCAADGAVTDAYARFAAREILGVEPVVLPGGHFPMLEDPAGLVDLLVALVEPSA